MSVETHPYGLDRRDPDIDIGMLDETLQSLEEPPKSMKETAEGLGRLAVALEPTHVPPAFTHVYHRLSTNITRAMDDGFFEHPDYIDHTAGTFAWYYYRNLRPYVDYMRGDDAALDNMAAPWRLPLLDPRVRDPSTLPGLQFSLGMTTHITSRDLTASLMASQPGEDYKSDFIGGVNHHIGKTTHELARELIPGHPLFRRAAIPPLLGMIAFDRSVAWRNYWKLNKMPTEEEREARYAQLDARAELRNKVSLTFGRVATPFVVGTERFNSFFGEKAA